MSEKSKIQYYLVDSSMLPEVFLKVVKAKTLLETGEAQTVGQAVAAAGISRSAFYKYKDSIAPFQDLKRGNIITFSLLLKDTAGLLSSVLSIFAGSGVNILTINQSIPTNGTAVVTISVETESMDVSMESLMNTIREQKGVLKLEVLAG